MQDKLSGEDAIQQEIWAVASFDVYRIDLRGFGETLATYL
jgi:hypothetical protein